MECFYCIKIIQDKFPHSRKVQFKDIRQYHPIISHSCQHVHIKRFQHQHIPQRKLILHISCTRTYQVWKFKHFLTSMPHPNHQTINSNHQARSSLHHTLCSIQKVHQDIDNITCVMHYPFQEFFPKKR